MPDALAIRRTFDIDGTDEDTLMAENEEKGTLPSEATAKYIAANCASFDGQIK